MTGMSAASMQLEVRPLQWQTRLPANGEKQAHLHVALAPTAVLDLLGALLAVILQGAGRVGDVLSLDVREPGRHLHEIATRSIRRL